MHPDLTALRAIALGLFLLFLYGSRLTKGSVVQTADGLAFRLKPLFAWAGAIALLAYILFFIYFVAVQKRPVTWWIALLFVAAITVWVMRMPGTITLTPMAIMQRFWFRPAKAIQYNEVMAIQAAPGSRSTHVLGDNRVKITHTLNHSAAKEFQQELERRTGKRVIA
jgi:hypothetical protein